MLFAAAILILNSAVLILQPAYADCAADYDWPEKPCLDMPPYAKVDLKAAWQKYYEYKGHEWMNMKKAEMDKAIEDGRLKEWTEYRSASDNFANYNVYFYYFVNDQAPDIYGFFDGKMNNMEPTVYWYGFPQSWFLAAVGIAVAGTAAIIFVFKKAKLTNTE